MDWIFTFACAAYNLVRMRNLAVPVPSVKVEAEVCAAKSGAKLWDCQNTESQIV